MTIVADVTSLGGSSGITYCITGSALGTMVLVRWYEKYVSLLPSGLAALIIMPCMLVVSPTTTSMRVELTYCTDRIFVSNLIVVPGTKPTPVIVTTPPGGTTALPGITFPMEM